MDKNNVKKSKEDIVKDFETIFKSIAAVEEDKVYEKFGGFIKEFINEAPCSLEDPEDFDIFVNYKVDALMDAVIKQLKPVEFEKMAHMKMIYKHYRYLENNISELIANRESRTCSIDKTRYIIKKYIEYLITGKEEEIERLERVYYVPNFGTWKEWKELIEGLNCLYYGNPEKYLYAYYSLIKADLKKWSDDNGK